MEGRKKLGVDEFVHAAPIYYSDESGNGTRAIMKLVEFWVFGEVHTVP